MRKLSLFVFALAALGPATQTAFGAQSTPGTPHGTDLAYVAVFFGDSLSMGFGSNQLPDMNPPVIDPRIQVNGSWVEGTTAVRFGFPVNSGTTLPAEDWYVVDDTQGAATAQSGSSVHSASAVYGFAQGIFATIDAVQAPVPDDVYCIQLAVGTSHAAINPDPTSEPALSWHPHTLDDAMSPNLFNQLTEVHIRRVVDDLLLHYDEVQLIGIFGSCGGGYIRYTAGADKAWVKYYSDDLQAIRKEAALLFGLTKTETYNVPFTVFEWHDTNSTLFEPKYEDVLRAKQNGWGNLMGWNNYLTPSSVSLNDLISDGVHWSEPATIQAGRNWAYLLANHWSPAEITVVN